MKQHFGHTGTVHAVNRKGKQHFAVDGRDGRPNILIDDRTKIIQQWQQAGGYGIKFQADEDSLNVVKQGLDSFYFNKEG